MNALLIGPDEQLKLATLRELASQHPVDMTTLMEALKHPAGKAFHRSRMSAQTVSIPTYYLVTFSIETGHPAGTCRHMSMSVRTEGRVPHPHAVWMVAEVLGFVGGLDQCVHWMEDLEGHGLAINLVQPVSVTRESTEVH